VASCRQDRDAVESELEACASDVVSYEARIAELEILGCTDADAAKFRRPIIKGKPRWTDGLCVECGEEFRCLRAVRVQFRRCLPCRKPPPGVDAVIERLATQPRF
jgi:hypothetical protein